VLPYAHYQPTLPSQVSIDKLVAQPVSTHLSFPKLYIGCRTASVYWAVMPKAAIDEYCHATPWEDEVGLAEERRTPAPPGYAMAAEQSDQR
jgi:hypothetical protein